jgi:gliding motility-associated-like protein
MKYDFIVSPGANAQEVAFVYDGADEVLLENGRLKIRTSVGEVWEQQPVAFQTINGEKKRVACEFVLHNHKVTFLFPKGYDKTVELVIDPELIFSTYSGSFADNFGFTATYDSQGFLYSGSSAFGQGYPTTIGAYQTTWGGGDGTGGLTGTDIAITKYNTTGTALVYSTFLGGENDELPHSLICNEWNECLVYGTTSSPNYPVTPGAYDSSFNGGVAFSPNGVGTSYVNGSDIIVTRLNATGSNLIQSTFVGGSANDGVNTAPALKFNYADEFRGEIDIDDNGFVWIASSTFSADFPLVDALQTTLQGQQEACIFRMSPDLSELQFSTFLGGTNNDSGYSLGFGIQNDVYICGGTQSSNFPIPNGGYQNNYQGGTADGWVLRLQNNQVVSGSFFGSAVYDQMYFVEADQSGNVYVYGQTLAPDNTFVINAAWSQANSGMVVAKFSSDLQNLTWSTVFGSGEGEPNLSPTAFLVDLCDKIYLSGWGGAVNTSSNASTNDTDGLFVTPNAYQSDTDGSDFYMLILFDDASGVDYASFYGGNVSAEHVDGGTSRFDRRGKMYQSVCAGCGSNDDFPIFPSNAHSATNNSNNCNNGVFKFDFEYPITIADFIVPTVSCVNEPIAITSTSGFATSHLWNFGDGTPTSILISPTHSYAEAGTYVIQLIVTNPATCNGTDTLQRSITITEPSATQLNDVQACEGEELVIGPSEVNTNATYAWSPATYLSNASTANPTFTAGASSAYTVLVSNGTCVDTLYLNVEVPQLSLSAPNDTLLCEEATLELTATFSPSNASIEWSNEADFSELLNSGNQDPTIEVNINEPSVFYVRVTIGDCVLMDTVEVNLVAFQTEIQGDFTACAGDSVTLNVLDPNPTFTYTWSPEEWIISGQNTTSVEIEVNGEGYVYVASIAPSGCEALDSVLVSVSTLLPNQVFATANPTLVVSGQTTQLQAFPPGFSYQWSPPSGVVPSTGSTASATPSETTTYTVQVSDGECAYSANVTVRVVEFVCGNPSIYIPNAFTPNTDNKNEWLYVRGNNITDLDFYVYNRWGELVFEAHDLSTGWNGQFKGRPVDPDVFVYYLEATCPGGERFIDKGNITVIR